jgi:hypothetical protein
MRNFRMHGGLRFWKSIDCAWISPSTAEKRCVVIKWQREKHNVASLDTNEANLERNDVCINFDEPKINIPRDLHFV